MIRGSCCTFKCCLTKRERGLLKVLREGKSRLEKETRIDKVVKLMRKVKSYMHKDPKWPSTLKQSNAIFKFDEANMIDIDASLSEEPLSASEHLSDKTNDRVEILGFMRPTKASLNHSQNFEDSIQMTEVPDPRKRDHGIGDIKRYTKFKVSNEFKADKNPEKKPDVQPLKSYQRPKSPLKKSPSPDKERPVSPKRFKSKLKPVSDFHIGKILDEEAKRTKVTTPRSTLSDNNKN